MQTRTGRCALLALALTGSAALAQSPVTTEERLDRTERRLDEMEKRHDAELKERDQRIADLEAELRRRPATAPARPAESAEHHDHDHDEPDDTRAAVLRDAESRHGTSPFQLLPDEFTPRVAVATDFVGSVSDGSDRSNDAYNRFDVREVHVDLRAAVTDHADGVVILSFERDVENPLFPEPGESPEGPESSTGVEEAYVFLHDFGVPNLTAKLGRFHVRFGRQNMLHLHDLPTTDPAFVNQAFLAPESLTDAGLSLSYVVPPKYTFGQRIEATAEVISGEGSDSESPTLGGDLTVDSPALNTHLLWNTDLRRDLNLELGASWLTGHGSDDNGQDVNLFGVDFTLLRSDPDGGHNDTLIQAEAMYGDVDGPDGDANHAFGAYLLGQQQVDRNLYVGLRLDWTENPLDDEQEAWGVTPYVSWYASESLRFRLSYQHRDLETEKEDVVYIQATWLLGGHKPHEH